MTTERAPRFKIGQQFKSHGRHPQLMTVTDILRTYNTAGELVRIRYVAQHQFMGQVVTDHDVCETTIARNLVQVEG